MPNDEPQPHSGDPLFREIIRDFESLARLIERAIDHFSVGETASEDLERLRLAKSAVERGAELAKSIGTAENS
jgi:hypothetical protein